MCGICGILQFDGGPADGATLDRMTLALEHRGPDGSGIYRSGRVGLGHRRLSIIDVDGGAQPISNECSSLHVVFNGEIYNFIELRKDLENQGHIFKTRSDTEVIVHAYEEWGLDCVKRFNGMFAFALWDEKRQRLFLARDHLGVKPLYYVTLPNRLIFASEIKALLQDQECPKGVDLGALSMLFTVRYVPSPDTLFDGIKKLPPAHYLIADHKGTEIKRYWNWKPQIEVGIDETALMERYQELLLDAVRLQMRSDVPVGLFLSSGIDSGVLLAIMSQYTTTPVRTFTIGFEDGEETNETEDARIVAARFGADHDEMIVGPNDYEAYYARYLWDLEEPVGNETAAAFYFVSMIASRKVKVALSGQGADEPWAGYPRHLGVKLSQIYSRLPRAVTDFIISPLIKKYAKDEKLRRGVVSLNEPDFMSRLIKIYSFYDSEMKKGLFKPWLQREISTAGDEAKEALGQLQADVADLDPLTQMTYIDTRASLPDDLLMVGDKMSMANSLEARVPFLDYRLVQFIETLPPGLRLHGFQSKYLHKKALEKWLPKKVIYRTKKGFANPIDKWLKGNLRRYIGDCLLSETSIINEFFERDFVKRLVTRHERGDQNYLRHIYLLISFEMWYRKFISGGVHVPNASRPLASPQAEKLLVRN